MTVKETLEALQKASSTKASVYLVGEDGDTWNITKVIEEKNLITDESSLLLYDDRYCDDRFMEVNVNEKVFKRC